MPVILVIFESQLHFLDRFSKNNDISSFMKIHLVGAELFHADGRTYMTKVTVVFRNFSKAPKTRHHWRNLVSAGASFSVCLVDLACERILIWGEGLGLEVGSKSSL